MFCGYTVSKRNDGIFDTAINGPKDNDPTAIFKIPIKSG